MQTKQRIDYAKGKLIAHLISVICLCLTGWVAQGAEPVLEFDGGSADEAVELDATVTLDGDFTIEYWFKTQRAGSWRLINNAADYDYSFGFRAADELAFWSPGVDIELTESFIIDTWEHLAVTRAGDTLRVYRNGNEVGSDDWSGEIRLDRIGGTPGNSGWSAYDGRAAEVRVWDHARSEATIQQLVDYRLTGNEEGLLGYWPLNEGSGDEVFDFSGQGNNGILENVAWVVDGDLSLLTPDVDFLFALPFTLADKETGSTDFTNSNAVDVVDFPVPDGYDRFQITEDGDVEAIDAGAWTNVVPATLTFTQPTGDTNITRYAWFTNDTESVVLRRGEGCIFYTEVEPDASVRATYSRQRIPGSPVQVLPSEIDDGSTGGEAGGVPMQIHAMSLNIVAGPDTDATPEEPYITVSELGDYTLSLTVINETGNVATSTVTCTLTVEEYAGQFTWTGEGDGENWHDPLNWSAFAVPISGEPVVIDNGASVWLTNSTAALSELTLTNATLTMANWDTVLEADTVTIEADGVITLPPPFTDEGPSNRIQIVCGDLTVATGGELNADGKGYERRYGPGAVYQDSSSNPAQGGSHGGQGGAATTMRRVMTLQTLVDAYGDPIFPEAPGSGGRNSNQRAAGHGGGAVRIEATGAVILDGAISANGMDVPGSHSRAAGGGSGGSILILSETITGSGILQANGGNGGLYDGNPHGGGGAGGRIAVHVNVDAQNGLPMPGLKFSVAPGTTPIPFVAQKYWWQADWGTLYLTDYTLFVDLGIGTAAVNGYIHQPDLGQEVEVVLDQLTITENTALGFDVDDVTLIVANALVVPENAALIGRRKMQVECGSLSAQGTLRLMGESTLTVDGHMTVSDATSHVSFNKATISVGGNLLVDHQSALRIFGAVTNGVSSEFGGSLTVAGDLTIANEGWLMPYSEPFNGGSVRIRCRNLYVDADSGIDVDFKGFAMYEGPGKGEYGTGSGGAGHGGEGGESDTGLLGGRTYGNSSLPRDAGSGGGHSNQARGGEGGGVIWLDVDGRIRLDGELTAMGQNGRDHRRAGGGGSGGSILLLCERLTGTGTLNASGGNGGFHEERHAGGGGGGRVAIWYGLNRAERQSLLDDPDDPASQKRILETNEIDGFDNDQPSVAGGSGYEAGGDGTVALFRMLPPSGTMIMLR